MSTMSRRQLLSNSRIAVALPLVNSFVSVAAFSQDQESAPKILNSNNDVISVSMDLLTYATDASKKVTPSGTSGVPSPPQQTIFYQTLYQLANHFDDSGLTAYTYRIANDPAFIASLPSTSKAMPTGDVKTRLAAISRQSFSCTLRDIADNYRWNSKAAPLAALPVASGLGMGHLEYPTYKKKQPAKYTIVYSCNISALEAEYSKGSCEKLKDWRDFWAAVAISCGVVGAVPCTVVAAIMAFIDSCIVNHN
jgi:hypothetical protein